MRDNSYARLLVQAELSLGDSNEARAERLLVKDSGEEEIRFSWWSNGNIVPRPLDMPESQWVELFKAAVRQGVFTDDFRKSLIRALSEGW